MVKNHGENTVGTVDTIEEDKYTFETNGADIWGTDDEFTFMYQEIDELSADNISVIATIDSVYEIDEDSAAGPMIRAGDGSGAYNLSARVVASEGGLRLTYRNDDKPETWYQVGPDAVYPVTIKLTRNENLFTAYYLDGEDWIQYAQIEVEMNGDILVGVGAMSGSTDFTTAKVSDIIIE
jgi:hypothetical protein